LTTPIFISALAGALSMNPLNATKSSHALR
jgi:hypothetical protein